MSSELAAQFAKQFRNGPLVRADLSLPLDRRHVVVLFGPSGCGKTTVLRCLAGLERPDSGSIRAGEQLWFDRASSVCLRPQQRDIGFLFQEYALFPHLSVRSNIAFGLSHLSEPERNSRVEEWLERFRLEGLEKRRPREISGGQQQRVALARALARRPRLLLLDEPLSALDACLRMEVRQQLLENLSELKIPSVLVTHDPDDVKALGDEVIRMQ